MIRDAILNGSPWVAAAGQALIAAGVGVIATLIRSALRAKRPCPGCGLAPGRHAGRRPAPRTTTPASAPVSPAPAGRVYMSDQTRLIPAARGGR